MRKRKNHPREKAKNQNPNMKNKKHETWKRETCMKTGKHANRKTDFLLNMMEEIRFLRHTGCQTDKSLTTD